MNILLFKRDLDQYSNADIKTMAKMYDLRGNVNDLRWMIAIKNSQLTASMITGDPFIDMNIVEQIDDDTLLQYCNTSPEIRKHCNPIWKERAKKIGYNGALAPAKDWQQIYIFLKKYKEILTNKEFKKVLGTKIPDRLQRGKYDMYIKVVTEYIPIIEDAIKLGATNIITWLIDTHNIDKVRTIRKAIALGATNIIKWLTDTYNIENVEGIQQFFITATNQCQLNILNILYQRYKSKDLSIPISLSVKIALEKGCVDILKFWKDKKNRKYTQDDAFHAFMYSNFNILDYFATIGLLPKNLVSYAINTNMIDGLWWLIDHGIEFSPGDIELLKNKIYGKRALKYYNYVHNNNY